MNHLTKRKFHVESSDDSNDEVSLSKKRRTEFSNWRNDFLPPVSDSEEECAVVDPTLPESPTKDVPPSPVFSSRKKRCRFVSENTSDENEDDKLSENLKPRCSVDILQTSSPKVKNVLTKPKSLDISDCEYSSEDDEFRINDEKKKKILMFFQESSKEELATISECSSKKAELISNLRPFTTWECLVCKLDKTKGLNTNLIDACIDLLQERQTLSSLMKKCEIISEKLQNQFGNIYMSKTESSQKLKYPTVQQPENIPKNLLLKPYQLIGLNWINLLHHNKVNGILADEMGLGKTVQTISFFAHLQTSTKETFPHLVVVPTSTLDNWVREFKTWCPSLFVLQYCGSQNERRYLKSELLKKRLSVDVIITTYNLAVSTPEDRALFRKLQTCYAVFDEGHMLKNMSSQRFQQLMRINAKRRLLLTGTPLQNNLLELMSLLKFVMPHLFEETTSTLVRIFAHTSNDAMQSNYYKKKIEHARQIMEPFVLRRIKSDVLQQLPEKKEKTVYCPLGKKQLSLYDKVKTQLKNKSIKNGLPKSEQRNVFMELRKVANHSLLRREYYNAAKLRKMAKLLKNDVQYLDADETYLFEDMEVMTDFELHKMCTENRLLKEYQLSNIELYDSAKFAILDEILPQFFKEGKRVLIFSQFTMMMDILQDYLKCRNHKFLRLDGQTPMNERITLIDTFNNDESYYIFILSTKAGGLGINLTSASVVILHDIDCNPYNDKQAEDRCHRLGQTKAVEVLKLVGKDTIEETMHEYAKQKLQLEKEMTNTREEELDLLTMITKALS